jgi:hypothetical protein
MKLPDLLGGDKIQKAVRQVRQRRPHGGRVDPEGSAVMDREPEQRFSRIDRVLEALQNRQQRASQPTPEKAPRLSSSSSSSSSDDELDTRVAVPTKESVRSLKENAATMTAMAEMAKLRVRAAGMSIPSKASIPEEWTRTAPVESPTRPERRPRNPLTFSDDELITELRRLRARLRRDPENVKFAFQRRMGRKSMTTALLKDVEEAAVTIIAAHWRAREVRVGMPAWRVAVAHRDDVVWENLQGALTRWCNLADTRRKLRLAARKLRLRYGDRAHYYVGDQFVDYDGDCRAWEAYETDGVAGVADAFRRWRFVAWSFVRWREWCVFEAEKSSRLATTTGALMREASDSDTSASAGRRQRTHDAGFSSDDDSFFW